MIEDLFQPTHLIIIAIIALIVLGPAKLGDVGGALGRSIREFRENSAPPVAPDHIGPSEQLLTTRIVVPASATGVHTVTAIHATDV